MSLLVSQDPQYPAREQHTAGPHHTVLGQRVNNSIIPFSWDAGESLVLALAALGQSLLLWEAAEAPSWLSATSSEVSVVY